MDIRTQSDLLAALITLALGISMAMRANRRVLRLFAILCGTLSAFYLGEFISALSSVVFFPRATLFVASTIPAAALAFFMEFLGVTPKNTRRTQLLGFAGALGGLGVALSPLFHVAAARSFVGGWVILGLLGSLSLLIGRAAGSPSPAERARLTWLAAGAGIAIGSAVLDRLPFVEAFPPISAILVTLYAFLLAQTLQRLRFLDLLELLGKTVSLSIQALFLVALYFALVYWAGGRLSLFLFNTLVVSIVVLILYEPLRSKADELVVAILFRKRIEMARALELLRDKLATVIDMPTLSKLVLDSLDETRRVTHASLYLLSDERPGFVLTDYRGPPPAPFMDATAARGLIAMVAAGRQAILSENIDRRLVDLRTAEKREVRRFRDEEKRLADVKAALLAMKAGLTLPLMGSERILGFLNLCDERVPEAFASNEIASLIEIASRMATAVENSKLFERMKERDRLAALGEMAAGLAHEIRNPLGAIKGSAQYLSPKSLPSEDREFLEVIVEEVDRLNSVVTNFLDYSRPLKQNFAPTDVGEVVRRTLKLFTTQVPANVAVTIEEAEGLPRVEADAEQLRQVLINLMQNAIQAMPDGGELTLVLGTDGDPGGWRFNESPTMVELRVRDSGVGFTDEMRRHAFIPFYTTKEKGTGLGLAICQRIVKNHGGAISVKNRAGGGTEFLIRLPSLSQGAGPQAPPPPPDLTPFPGTLNRAELAVKTEPRGTKRRQRHGS